MFVRMLSCVSCLVVVFLNRSCLVHYPGFENVFFWVGTTFISSFDDALMIDFGINFPSIHTVFVIFLMFYKEQTSLLKL